METARERRQKRRASVDFLVSETTGGRAYQPLLTSVSEDGLSVEFPAGFDLRDDHASFVEIMIPQIPEIVFARCRIVRDRTQSGFRQRALKFIDISPIHRSYLRKYVHTMCGHG